MTLSIAAANTGNDTPIWWPLRLWLAVEVLFAVMAGTPTFLRPEDAATGFAWPIPVAVMAAVLGVFYGASFPVAVWAVLMKRWQDVRLVAVTLGVFGTLMTLMTWLHHDKFSVGTSAYWLWVISYVVPPPLFAGMYFLHQRRSAPVGTGLTHPLPANVRTVLRANGLLLLALGLAIFALPAPFIEIAPFTLTPLTARTLANLVMGFGLIEVLIAWEGDWLRARLGALLLILVAPLLVLQLARYPADVRWDYPFLVFLVGDSFFVAALLVRVWLTVGRKG